MTNAVLSPADFRRNGASLALVVLILILCGGLYLEWQRSLALRTDLLAMRALPATPVPEQKILPEFALPDLASGFTELNSRPVFSQSRRYPPPPSQTASAMKKGQFVLVGVMITPKEKAALLRDTQTQKTQTVVMGAGVRGMTLGDVSVDRVILRLGDESEELPLQIQRSVKTPVVGSPPQSTPNIPLVQPAPRP
jgi:hypothetical protein